MTKMNKKQQIYNKRTEREEQEHQILNKILGIFIIGAIAEIYALICYRLYVQGTTAVMLQMNGIIDKVSYVGLAAAVIGILMMLICRKKPKPKYLGFLVLLLGLVVALASRVMLLAYPQGTMVMCVMIPVFTVYGFVYYLYQHEFFVGVSVIGASMFSVWMFMKGGGWWHNMSIGFAVAVLVAIVLVAVLTRTLSKNDGKWGKGGKEKAIYLPGANYSIQYGTLAVSALAVVIALAASAFAMYMLWVLVAAIFILAIYYTIRLM